MSTERTDDWRSTTRRPSRSVRGWAPIN